MGVAFVGFHGLFWIFFLLIFFSSELYILADLSGILASCVINSVSA